MVLDVAANFKGLQRRDLLHGLEDVANRILRFQNENLPRALGISLVWIAEIRSAISPPTTVEQNTRRLSQGFPGIIFSIGPNTQFFPTRSFCLS